MEALRPDDPETIGSYRLLARLGAGGMGRVYLGRSAGGRTVAIKVIRAEFAAEPQFRYRFRREVDAARRVGGRWTAPVLDADPEAEQPWLVTAFVPGPSLQDAVREHGPLPVRTVRALGAGLAEALIAVHGAGLVHRDLKPSNVLLGLDGPKVIDFGISRAIDATILTHTGAAVGSPAYMAPEQIGTGEIGPATDVFALGIVLTYAATGAPPFRAPGLPALMYAILSYEPDLAEIPAELRELVETCLRKDPALRPTPAAVLARLAPGAGAESRGTSPATALMAAGWLPPDLVTALSRSALALLDLDAPTRGQPTPHPTPPPFPTPSSSLAPSTPPAVASAMPSPPPPSPPPLSPPPPSPPPPSPPPPSPPPPSPSWSPSPGPSSSRSSRRTGFIVAIIGAAIAGIALVSVLLVVVLRRDDQNGTAGGDRGLAAASADADGPAAAGSTLRSGPTSTTGSGSTTRPASGAATGSTSGSSGDAAVPAAYLGTWQGALSDSSGIAQNVVITVRRGQVGGVVAHSEVTTDALASVTGKELRCIADMRLTAASDTITLQDVPGSGGDNEPTLLGLPLCAHGGQVTLHRQADGTVLYTSAVPGTSNPTGTLTRAR